MKAALVLTGLARCWEKAYPSFKAYVLDRYDTDVYIDIWSEAGYYSGKGYLPEENGFVRTAETDRGFHDSGERVDANKLLEVYNPREMNIENFNIFEPHATSFAQLFPRAFTRPKNTICQAYKVWRGTSLISDTVHYDLVIRARPDIVLEHDPGEWQRGKFYTLPSRNKVGQGTGDTIQVGSYYNMMEFGQMYHNLDTLYEKCGVSCPHMYAQAWIQENQFDWQEMNVGAHVAHSPKGLYQEPD